MRQQASPETISEQMRLFGQNVRAARNAKGWPQNSPHLSRGGLDKAMVSRLELGMRLPRLPKILRVASVLEVPPRKLLEGIGTDETPLALLPPPSDLEWPAARLGANVKWARNREGISQMDLAGESGVDRAGVGAIERGERDPRLDTILKLAWSLELPPAVLLHGVENGDQG